MDTDKPDIGTTWARIQATLPEGWAIDSLRCASDGLAVGQRADDSAVAVGPDGEERRARAADPIAALDTLPGANG